MARVAPKPWEEAYRLQGRLWRGARLDDATLRLLAARPELTMARWLECGCGDGKGLVPLARAVQAPVVAFDASRQGLRLAQAAAAHEGVATRLVEADVRLLPLRPGSFGAVRSVHVLGHLLQRERAVAVQGLARLLRPGGAAVFLEFSRADFRVGKGEEVEPGTFRRGHGIVTHYFAERELVDLVEGAGLVVEDRREDRFVVTYHGVDRVRSRVAVVASRPDRFRTRGGTTTA